MDEEKVLEGIKACAEFCRGECPYQYLDDPNGELKLKCIHALMVDINKLVNIHKKTLEKKVNFDAVKQKRLVEHC